MTYWNAKRANLLRRYGNPKCVCTKQQSCQIRKAKLIDVKGEIGKCTIINGDFTSISFFQQLIEHICLLTEHQQRFRKTQQHCQPTGSNQRL